ncbi:MAG: hypothetical protein IJ906_16095, partial [Oscillospiraceae bacterium]|nr:hypothetical protein [Oscillospiraceae bacterium]
IQTIAFNSPQWASRCLLFQGEYPGLAALTPLHYIVYDPIIKVMDETDYDTLPNVMQALDITNFLGRFAVWIFIAVCISVYSSSARRAALHVFLFFAGMVSSYYLYAKLAAGFFPLNYALIWCGFTVISPLLACICWYAKGNGWASILISAGILGVLLSQAVFLFRSPFAFFKKLRSEKERAAVTV